MQKGGSDRIALFAYSRVKLKKQRPMCVAAPDVVDLKTGRIL